MIESIKKLFGIGPKTDFAALIAEGALIVDVRSKDEYSRGHIKGSLHIQLDQLSSNFKKFKSKEQVIITCCASGMRSASGRSILKQAGYQHVYNGGGWSSLNKYITK
jgi:phage shock protein E